MDIDEFLKDDEDVNEYLKDYLVPKPKSQPDKMVTRYRIIIERAVSWESRQIYFNLVEDFLKNKIGCENFTKQFCHQWYKDSKKISKICEKIEENLDSIPDFSYTTKSIELCNILGDYFLEVDYFSEILENAERPLDQLDNIQNIESEFRSVTQKIVPILKKSCDAET